MDKKKIYVEPCISVRQLNFKGLLAGSGPQTVTIEADSNGIQDEVSAAKRPPIWDEDYGL